MAEKTGDSGTVEIDGQKFEPEVHEDLLVTFKDKGGHELTLHEWEGRLWNTNFKLSLVKEIKNFKLRDDDVYFIGYPRSGTHWTFEMLSMLLNGKAETIEGFKEHLELVDHKEMDKKPSPRVVHAHLFLTMCPTDVAAKKVKVVCTLRDPKDIIVSIYRMYYGVAWPRCLYKGCFKDYLGLHLAETIDFNGVFAYYRDMEKYMEDNPDVPVYFQVYEDAQKDIIKSLQNLSDFLGLKRDDDLCKAIAEKCEFSRMKKDKDKYAFKIDGQNFLYRKGKSGDWRNYFTEEMLDDYYRVYEEKMAGSRFYKRYAREND